MKILFIQNDHHSKLGVMYLSAHIKKAGHECDLLIDFFEKKLIRKIKEIKPDIIGFSCLTIDHPWLIKTTRKIKRSLDLPVLVGGPHATFFPETITEKSIDIIMRGEAEETITELLDRLEKGNDISDVAGVWFKKNGKIIKNEKVPLIEDVNKLLLPDREIYYLRYKVLMLNPIKKFISQRGCPYSCTYCYNSILRTYTKGYKYLRRISPEHTIEDILDVKKKYGLEVIYTYDDCFTKDKRWLYKFLELYKRRVKLPFYIQTRADQLDEKTIVLLKQANCKGIAIGVETSNEEYRKKILNKYVTNKQIIACVDAIHKNNIRLKVYYLHGLPGYTKDDYFKDIEFNQKIRPFIILNPIVKYFSKLELTVELIKRKEMRKTSNPFMFYNRKCFEREIANLNCVSLFAPKTKLFIPLANFLIKLPLEPISRFIGCRYREIRQVMYLFNSLKQHFKLVRFGLYLMLKYKKIFFFR